MLMQETMALHTSRQPGVEPRTLAGRAYLALRQDIVVGRLAPGERLRVVARSLPGGDPIAVRVGRTTFALRRREASLIRVTATAPAHAALPASRQAPLPEPLLRCPAPELAA